MQDNKAEKEFLYTLRRETARSHEHLEATPLSESIVSASADISVVKQFLLASFDCYYPLEALIRKKLGEKLLAGYWRYEMQSPLLAKDLDLLQATCETKDSVHQIDTDDCGFYVGGLYVLSGAQLGKQVIAKKLEGSSPDFVKNSTYFSGTAKEDHKESNWCNYRSGLNQLAIDYSFTEQAVRGAKYFFEVFLNRWTQYPPATTLLRQQPVF